MEQRYKTDEEYQLEKELNLRSDLVTILLDQVRTRGISAARKAVSEDKEVRRVYRRLQQVIEQSEKTHAQQVAWEAERTVKS